jgi:hypothetical protein
MNFFWIDNEWLQDGIHLRLRYCPAPHEVVDLLGRRLHAGRVIPGLEARLRGASSAAVANLAG